jgi:hypothetical protein
MQTYVKVPPLQDRISRDEALETARECYREMHDGRFSVTNRHLAEKELRRYCDAFDFTLGDIMGVTPIESEAQ